MELKEPLEKTMLNQKSGRYDLVAMSRAWMLTLRGTEEVKNMTQAEIIRKAVEDVASGKVTAKDIREAMARKAANAPVEEPKGEKAGKEEIVPIAEEEAPRRTRKHKEDEEE